MVKRAPIKLTLRKVVNAALKAFKTNSLQCQNKLKGYGVVSCQYKDKKGFRCVIGACLSEEDITYIKRKKLNSVGIRILIDKGIVTTDDQTSLTFRELQRLHDAGSVDLLLEKLNELHTRIKNQDKKKLMKRNKK